MRGSALVFTMFVSILTFGAVLYSTRSPEFELQDQIRDPAILAQFMETLDAEIMKECVADHESGRGVDLDYLATCGDFDLYSQYMRISKFEAVKKFEYVLVHSSSLLEFEDRLSH
jgi:hypothetical protein